MLRKARFGLEMEFLILDEAGQPANAADLILERCAGTMAGYHVRPECSRCMIEIGATPRHTVAHTAHGFLRNMARLVEKAGKLGLRLFPLATYPGTVVPSIRKKPWYDMQGALLGPRWREVTGSVAGFHMHVALPRGTMGGGSMRRLYRARAARLLVNQFNFLVAADPALITLTQSSPFFNGRHPCKDSRVLLYRNLEMPQGRVSGIYHRHPAFGSLPRYAHAMYDFEPQAEARKRSWLSLLSGRSRQLARAVEGAHPMRFSWGPVRVNRKGTYEQRGMDMNLPKIIFGTSTLLKRALARVARDGLIVTPSEIGIKQPFRVEGAEVFVPPYHYLVDRLTMESLEMGLAGSRIRGYAGAFCRFALEGVHRRKDASVRAVQRMLARRKTVSDDVMAMAGMRGEERIFEVGQGKAAEIAVSYSEALEKEVSELISRPMLMDEEVRDGGIWSIIRGIDRVIERRNVLMR